MVMPVPIPQRQSFSLGQIVATPGALATLERANQDPLMFLARHAACDWGEVDAEDRGRNDHAVAHEGDLDQQERVLSSYKTNGNETIWIITEADRSSSCLLRPDEY